MTTIVADNKLAHLRQTDARLAPLMFGLAILFLILLAALIVTHVDIPRVVELSVLDSVTGEISSDVQQKLAGAEKIGSQLLTILLVLWPIFIIESVYQFTQARSISAETNLTKKRVGYRLMSAIFPPLRLGMPSAAWGGRIWLPVLSWVHPGKLSTLTLTRFFSRPMIAIALLILPVLLLEFGFKGFIAENFWLQMVIHTATGFIWFAFTVEFILMVSVTDKKLRYIKKNWIDLAIIVLPLISFLRGIRALRLAKLAKVQQLAKMGRIYRMRGLGMKLLRALLLFEVVNRILRITPEKQLAKLEATRAEHLEELEEMDDEIAELKAAIAIGKH